MMCPFDTCMQLFTASDQIETVALFLNVQIRNINVQHENQLNFYFYLLVYIIIYYYTVNVYILNLI